MSEDIIVHSELVDEATGQYRYTVERFPSVSGIDLTLLGQSVHGVIQVADPEITFTFANGSARYRLALSEPERAPFFPMYLISSRIDES